MRRAAHGDVIDQNASAERSKQAGDEMEQRRFACSRSPDNCNVLARCHQTGDAAQNDAVIMPESDVADLDRSGRAAHCYNCFHENILRQHIYSLNPIFCARIDEKAYKCPNKEQNIIISPADA